MGNQQLYDLSSNESQLLLSLYLGDGHYQKYGLSSEYHCITSSINEDLLIFKKSLCTNLINSNIKLFNNPGYNKKSVIYRWNINSNAHITYIYNLSLEEKINNLDELGLALWFLDDGSLHKVKNFYNLCTHSFSLEDNILIKDKLNFKFGTDFRITSELKKDGRKFYYLSIRKIGGANIISDILSKYPIESMKYKLWSSETIHEWSTLQEKWKSQDSNLINFEKFAKSFYLRMGHSKNKKIKLIG